MLPAALASALVFFPVFRFAAYRQMRLTCFVPQGHVTTSRFPLQVRKFACIPKKSILETTLCMRNAFERRKAAVMGRRTLVHRFVHLLWSTTNHTMKELRFYGMITSWLILVAMFAIMAFTLTYILVFTKHLQDDAVFHWVGWTLTMFFFHVLVLEPAWIFFYEVLWCAFAAAFGQKRGFGIHSQSATTKYRDVVRQIESLFFNIVCVIGAMRVQRWWRAVLDMYKCIHEQTVSAIKIQAMRKKQIQMKNFAKNRKWCLSVEVKDCAELEEVDVGTHMSPLVRLQCDTGNDTILQTEVAWEQHRDPKFGQKFLIDVKDSTGLYVTVWSKDLASEEFVGRGHIGLDALAKKAQSSVTFTDVPLNLHDIQLGELPTRDSALCGICNLRLRLLDPSRDDTGDNSWMLPKHKMAFAMNKVGGRLKVGKMLGALGAQGVSHMDSKELIAAVSQGTPVRQGTAAGVGRPVDRGQPTAPAAGPPGMEAPGATVIGSSRAPAGRPSSGMSLTGQQRPPAAGIAPAQVPPGTVQSDGDDDDDGA